ncbi:unnamed protein product [Adineta steineri]|uniref:Uncharacterized protein n=1 Tax=Adineta steineri TaxID=433720 RepID=A0A813VAW9_9BILA|nr:unnamed protein product [Adineta steineri]
MYAPLPAAVVRRNRETGFSASGPILAICCLGFVIFLIAATIVLALIPVYLSKRSGGSSSSSTPRYTMIMNPGTALPEGTLNSQSLSNINSAMNNALNLQSGSFVSESGTVATGGKRKRKREGFEIFRDRRAGTTQLYIVFHFNKQKCDKCGNMGYLQSIPSFPVTVVIFINSVQYTTTFTSTLVLTSTNNPSTSTAATASSGSSGSTSTSYALSFTAPANLPAGPVDAASLGPLGTSTYLIK